MGVVELEAAAALYAGAALEPLGPFAIVDRILELWLARGLPVGATGEGSRALDRYWLHRNDRLTEAQRRDVYGAVFDARFDELSMALVVALAEGRGPDVERRADMVRAHVGARIDERTLALTPLALRRAARGARRPLRPRHPRRPRRAGHVAADQGARAPGSRARA